MAIRNVGLYGYFFLLFLTMCWLCETAVYQSCFYLANIDEFNATLRECDIASMDVALWEYTLRVPVQNAPSLTHMPVL